MFGVQNEPKTIRKSSFLYYLWLTFILVRKFSKSLLNNSILEIDVLNNCGSSFFVTHAVIYSITYRYT